MIRCLKHSRIQPCPNRIIFLEKEWQIAYEDLKTILPTIEFHEGLDTPALTSITSANKYLLIIDDLMSSAGIQNRFRNSYAEISSQKFICVFLVQNLFYHGKEMRNIILNVHYLVLYKNPRDKSQSRYLPQHVFPENPKFQVNSYQHATTNPHSYLVLDLHPDTTEDFRILTNILPDDSIRYYLPTTL